jgi:hypothetical protein
MHADELRSTNVAQDPSASICVHLRLLCVGSVLLVGCSSAKQPTTRPASAYDRQEEALKDPFSYSPNKEKQDVSGGGISEYDKKAMKRDIDHVLNP